MKNLKILSIICLLAPCLGFSPSKINCFSSCNASSDKYVDSRRVRAFVSTIEMPFSKNKVISKDDRFTGEIGTSGLSTFDFKIGYKDLYIRDNQHLDFAIMAKNVKSFIFSEDSKFAYIEFVDGLQVTYDLCEKKEVSCKK